MFSTRHFRPTLVHQCSRYIASRSNPGYSARAVATMPLSQNSSSGWNDQSGKLVRTSQHSESESSFPAIVSQVMVGNASSSKNSKTPEEIWTDREKTVSLLRRPNDAYSGEISALIARSAR